MATPPALPAPGRNATAALADAGVTRLEEMVIHSGAATTEGDMSHPEDDFDPLAQHDPFRNDPRRMTPGALDSSVEFSQLNTINFNNIDQSTAQVAVAQQGVDPALAGQMMAAQQQAFQSEANALHAEVMERQRGALVSEAPDHLTRIEQTAAEELSQKNFLLNEQAAHAMSEQKSAQLHVQSQDHRIKELSAELSQIVNTAGLMSTSVDKSNADLHTARSELAEYRTQLETMNQHSLDMKKAADSQRRDFEAEIEKRRKEQKELIRSLKSQPLQKKLLDYRLQIQYGPGKPSQQPSQPSRPIIEELDAGGKKPLHSSDADDEHFMAGPFMPPGLPGGGPPDDDDDDSDDGKRGRKDKKDKKKGRKASRGRSRRRRRRDPSSSPSSSSPTTSSSDSESSFMFLCT